MNWPLFVSGLFVGISIGIVIATGNILLAWWNR
jgi:hypothetical protein